MSSERIAQVLCRPESDINLLGCISVGETKRPPNETQLLILSFMADGREWRIRELKYQLKKIGKQRSDNAIRQALLKLENKGIVKRTGWGKYIIDRERAEIYIKFYKYFFMKGG